jgi:hypothetical protein
VPIWNEIVKASTLRDAGGRCGNGCSRMRPYVVAALSPALLKRRNR